MTDHMPRIAMMPWSSPVYDDRSITVDPDVFCTESIAGTGVDRCHCRTGQGTRYRLPDNECRYIARGGRAYNPCREQCNERQEARNEPSSTPAH